MSRESDRITAAHPLFSSCQKNLLVTAFPLESSPLRYTLPIQFPTSRPFPDSYLLCSLFASALGTRSTRHHRCQGNRVPDSVILVCPPKCPRVPSNPADCFQTPSSFELISSFSHDRNTPTAVPLLDILVIQLRIGGPSSLTYTIGFTLTQLHSFSGIFPPQSCNNSPLFGPLFHFHVPVFSGKNLIPVLCVDVQSTQHHVNHENHLSHHLTLVPCWTRKVRPRTRAVVA